MSPVDRKKAAGGLRAAAAICGVATVPVALWLPVYSSGETVADNVGALFFIALGFAVCVSCIPLLVPDERKRSASVAGGALILLGSFVSGFGLFLLPAGLLLLLSAAVSRAGRPSAKTFPRGPRTHIPG